MKNFGRLLQKFEMVLFAIKMRMKDPRLLKNL